MDIIEYIFQTPSMNEIALSISIPIAGISTYVGALFSLSFFSDLFSEKIKNQEHLNKLIEKEFKKLKLDPIPSEFKESDGTAHLTSYINNTYDITFYKGDTLSTIRHEVYHYYTKKHQTLLTKQFNEETRAILYESLRIKL